MRCFIAGEGTLAIHCAETILQRGHTITGIVSADNLLSRWAEDRSLRRATGDAELFGFASAEPFDVLFSIVNGTIIPPQVLELPRICAINYHDGLLPRYAGFNTPAWAILNDEQRYGITWHLMTAKVDDGGIAKQRTFDVGPAETAFSLNTRCYEAAVASFAELLDEIAGESLTIREQNRDERRFYSRYKRPPSICVVDWNQPAGHIERLTRALDFGPYPNPLGVPRFVTDRGFVVLHHAEVTSDPSTSIPGTVVAVDGGRIRIATATTDLVLSEVKTPAGTPIHTEDLTSGYGIIPGAKLAAPKAADLAEISSIYSSVAANEPYWVARLQASKPSSGPAIDSAGRDNRERLDVAAQSSALASAIGCTPVEALVTVILAFLARSSGEAGVEAGFRDYSRRPAGSPIVESFFAPLVPLSVGVNVDVSIGSVAPRILEALRRTAGMGTYIRDLPARYPELRATAPGQRWSTAIQIGGPALDTAADLSFHVDSEGALSISYQPSVHARAAIERLTSGFVMFLRGLAGAPEQPISSIPYLDDAETRRIIAAFNDTQTLFDSASCIHHLFERVVQSTPDAPAIAFEGRELTYRELNRRANSIARPLIDAGVGPNTLVGVCIERSVDMVAALLGVLKAGGAYVPLDPDYPAGRIEYLVSDAAPRVILTQRHLSHRFRSAASELLCVEDIPNAETAVPDPAVAIAPNDLAYVIYTSGSTGQPKGVMITHRNVTNFFAGMDDCAGAGEKGVWLAVTSISFDISVFELFWTLARGFKVVIQGEDRAASFAPTNVSGKPVDFSLFYFAAGEAKPKGDKYRLLMEGARFADQHGFSAVWTPERHFHGFGGLYPNPAVVGAALAAITSRVKIRAGSVVLPLHHPLRVAEEWALVDNLSNGRVGISFAAGWQANDFVLAPDRYANSKQILFENLDTVRRLWRGEAVSFKNGKGIETPTRTLPRPVQEELPVWITAAMNVETFIAAGRAGANILTHLLGQTLETVASKIAAYRQAWTEAGHVGSGTVTLMLHTYVGDDYETVKETVRGPMCAYLRSSADLIKNSPWSFPAFHNRPSTDQQASLDFSRLTNEEMDAIVDHAFERYFETSGLFGTPETCLDMVRKVEQIGVDEIGCLVDFGVDEDLVLRSLPNLNRLRQLSAAPAGDYSIPAQIQRHNVTHMQCTPSMARMLMDGGAAPALGQLRKMFVGGEALAPDLALRLARTVPEVHNMFGPTETTIWSTTHRLAADGGPVPIGRPIANTQVYVLGPGMQIVAPGVTGELYIGGEGVAKGYLRREVLTEERFVPDPFSHIVGARLYKTGDLASFTEAGVLEFHGRVDNQVKIRGHRIELGEIEAALNRHPQLRESAVIAREDSAGKQLVAYIVPRNGVTPSIHDLRGHVAATLPEYMVPASFVPLPTLPLTPNGKVDRKALPDAGQTSRTDAVYVAPEGGVEDVIASTWQEVLRSDRIGRDDNFFDLGAHSLMVVQVGNQLKQKLSREISVVDMFRYPTVRLLAAHLSKGPAAAAEPVASSRAKARREFMNRARAGV